MNTSTPRPSPSSPSQNILNDIRQPPRQPRSHNARNATQANLSPPLQAFRRDSPAAVSSANGFHHVPTGPRGSRSTSIPHNSPLAKSRRDDISVSSLIPRDGPHAAPTGPRNNSIRNVPPVLRETSSYSPHSRNDDSNVVGRTSHNRPHTTPAPPTGPRIDSSAVSFRNVPTRQILESEPRFNDLKRKHRAIDLDDSEHSLIPWADLLTSTEYDSKEQRLHEEILSYSSFIRSTTEERTARRCLVDYIARAIQARFPLAVVRLFGSAAQDLCLPAGDIDLVVSIPDVEDAKRVLFQLSNVVKMAGLTATTIVNHWARVPVVSFTTIPDFASVKVDISLNKDDGPLAVPLIKEYLETMPPLRPLILVLKGFLSQRHLNSAATSGLSGYALTCMCISFLQLNPTSLPIVYLTDPTESGSLGRLLLDFLAYYGSEFPYDTSYISVTDAKLLPKEQADWISNSQRESLAIQCLVRKDNDIAKSVGKIETIRTAFREAHSKLLAMPFDPENCDDYLGAIVRVSPATLQWREDVRNLISGGRLEAKVSTSTATASSSRSGLARGGSRSRQQTWLNRGRNKHSYWQSQSRTGDRSQRGGVHAPDQELQIKRTRHGK